VFGSRIRTKSLAHVCRSLGTMLHAGIDVKRSFKLAANKSGDPRCRRALKAIVEGIDRGDDISTAMHDQGSAFPGLMIDMISVAEQSGALPEILIGLADHYENNLRLRRAFLASIAWPVIQLVLAILVIAAAILILGWISETRGDSGVDILGLGLSGSSGAITWLMCTFGPIAGLLLGYKIIAGTLNGKRFVDPLLMRIPVVGHCMRSFAIARFSWAYYLTQQTGMPIKQSLTASLRATGNGAFIARTRIICDRVQSGELLTAALASAEIFPEDFLHMVDVGETSGTVPETLNRLSPQFEERARRSLTALTMTLGFVVWGVVAAFIIFLVFSIFLSYVGMIEEAAKPI
jgi:type IV pilus assembly protein PilC